MMSNLIVKLCALILLILASPLLFFVCVAILIIDRDKIIFKQSRLGLNQIPFTIYKLRSMKHGKITLIGKIIRKTGIDEIPQLINIIKGDIKFIGPRPLTEDDVVRLQWNTKFHNFRWLVKPGLTGLAQLSPVCHKKMSLFWDKHYVNHQSFWLNLKIFFASIFVMMLGKKVVQNIIHKRQ